MLSLILAIICFSILGFLLFLKEKCGCDIRKKYGNEHFETVTITKSFHKNLEGDYYILVHENKLVIQSPFIITDSMSFDLDDVIGFELFSEIKKHKISIGKAIVGGILLSGVGAILGGLMGKEELINGVLLVVKRDGDELPIMFSRKDYEVLKALIPDKKVDYKLS